MEVKYDSPSRDLIYELTKALSFANRHKYPSYICVLSDDFSDPYILKFIKDNGIFMYKIIVKDNDINTLSLQFVESEEQECDIEEFAK
jgi:hypothetical protein